MDYCFFLAKISSLNVMPFVYRAIQMCVAAWFPGAVCGNAPREAVLSTPVTSPFKMLYSAGAAKLYYIFLKCVSFQLVEKPSSLINRFMKPIENGFCDV